MTHILAIAHPGGGVGKSTTTLNLAYSLAARDRRVCVVDLDPGGELSDRLDVPPRTPALADVLIRGQGTPHPVPLGWPGGWGFDFVSAGQDSMIGIELQLQSVQHAREYRLRAALQGLVGQYDYVLIDCPPNITTLTLNALYAADALLVPVQAHPKAVRQLAKFWETVAEVNGYRAAPLNVLGLLVTMYDGRESVQQEVLAIMQADPRTFTTIIPRKASALADSLHRAPAAVYDPRNGLAAQYIALAEEVIHRAES